MAIAIAAVQANEQFVGKADEPGRDWYNCYVNVWPTDSSGGYRHIEVEMNSGRVIAYRCYK